MSQNIHSRFSRRHFLGAITASGAALGAAAAPASITALANDQGQLDPNRTIKIVSTQKLSDSQQKAIKDISSNIDLHMASDNSSTQFDDAEVVLGWIEPSVLTRAKKLKWVQVWSAGVEDMPRELAEHPFILTNMQRIFSPVIAETAIALLLSLTRGISQFAVPQLREKNWSQDPPKDTVLDDLYGKTIGIVGLGGIGSDTACRLHYGFNMEVMATDAKAIPRPEFVKVLRDPSWFMEMVPQVDVLMSAAPLTAQTKKMFNAKVFGAMKSSAYFINMSRGGLVDQPALVEALKSKRIRGAGLDVVTPEPLPSDNPLWTAPNVVITAHNSGFAASRQTRIDELIKDNIQRYAAGQPLRNVVDKSKGY